jgi:thiamine transporter ThiT
MRTISAPKTGFAAGILVGLLHLFWAALVALGWAQPLIDFILRLHFIKLSLEIQPFDPGTAAGLVAITSVAGFTVGFVLALVWNWLNPADRAA